MTYMKFQKKMLGGSDFFLDFDSQIFRNLFDFSPSTPKKAQNFFAAAHEYTKVMWNLDRHDKRGLFNFFENEN